jgi:hypothetical protein
MSKSIQQIEQELTATETAVIDIGKELEEAYRVYLKALSETTKKQFLLGSYYICTQIYPESFLNLNKKKQEIMQQTLIQIGKIIEILFYQYISVIFKLSRSNISPNPSSVSETKQAATEPLVEKSVTSKSSDAQNLTPKNLDRSNSETTIDPNRLERNKSNPDIIKLNPPNNNTNNLVSIATLIENSDRSAETLSNLKEAFQEKLQIISSPEDLLLCHKQIEQGINKSLEILSLETNQKLQQAGILPQKVPAQLLEIPLLSGDAGTPVRGLPHLLELNIEIGNSSNSNSQDTENKIFAKIVLLRLKLTEIEFVDFNLAKKRDIIRKLISEIERLRHLYLQLKKEYSIALAERDWRSIWYEN